jgi:serine phosphatase RsbU (regulator of sigma subunit)
MEIQISVAKTNKFSSNESGDTLETVERPMGGVSVVLADAQHSGKEAKIISSMVVRKVISLLAEGVRDGAAARAASDYLFTERGGKESVCLNILSADFQTRTLVVSRNNPVPVFIAQRDNIECISRDCPPIGNARNIRPLITEIPLEPGTSVVMYTDGLASAGESIGHQLDVCTTLRALMEEQDPSADLIADALLSQAIRLDQGRPEDDMSIIVLRVLSNVPDKIRRMKLRLPVEEEELQTY